MVDAAEAQLASSGLKAITDVEARIATVEALGRIVTEEEAVAAALLEAGGDGGGAVPDAVEEEEVATTTTQDGDEITKMKKKAKKKTLPCPVCLKLFSTENVLKSHMTRFHEQDSKLCKECGKTFGHTSTLRAHINNIHRGLRFSCDQVHSLMFDSYVT